MTEAAFAAEPSLLHCSSGRHCIVTVIIIKFKIHPVLSSLISALVIGSGAGMRFRLWSAQ